MKVAKILLGAAVACSLLSVSSFAYTASKHADALSALPVVSTVVNPTGLPPSAEGATVMVRMTLDKEGQPHHVRIVSRGDAHLADRLVPVIRQWRFTPAQRNGEPVAVEVLLPVQLVAKA